MASQGSDRLKAILAAAQEKARAAQAALPAEPAVAETRRVEALLDRNEALPDPRALARLYREKALVDRLPEDEDAAAALPASPPSPPPSTAAVPVQPPVPAVPAAAQPAVAPEPAPAEPQRPPLSPTQIREIMAELKEQFAAGTYETFEAKPLPVEVIPTEDDQVDEVPLEEETSEVFYILGAVLALAVIGVFVYLALSGPLRYHPPATPTPKPTVSAR